MVNLRYLLFLTIGLPLCADAQIVTMSSPKANEEFCLGNSVVVKSTVTNGDNVARTLKVTASIRNVNSGTQLYSESSTVTNVAAGASVDAALPSFVTNANMLSQLGTHELTIILSALDGNAQPITNWAFADTLHQMLFGIKRMAAPFRDPSNGYAQFQSKDLPDQTKFVSVGATVIEGDSMTWDPPPPRDRTGAGFGPDALRSPVIRLDRTSFNGVRYAGKRTGDTLTSFPINLTLKTKAIVSFDFMRGGKNRYPAMIDMSNMLAPEGALLSLANQVLGFGDSLIVEFRTPSTSACTEEKWTAIAGIDGARDLEFKSFYLEFDGTTAKLRITDILDSAFTLPVNYLDSNFRFRLRLSANDNSTSIEAADDDDPFFVDNIAVVAPSLPEFEVSWVRIVTPYSKLPLSEVTDLPIYAKVRSTSNHRGDVPVRVVVTDKNGTMIYSERVVVPVEAGQETIASFPRFNAQNGLSASYLVSAGIDQQGFDSFSDDDATYSYFYLNVDADPNMQEFAYDDAGLDPLRKSGNDVPLALGLGSGLGFENKSGSFAMKFTLTHPDTVEAIRAYFASANSADERIRIVLYADADTTFPGQPLPGTATMFEAKRAGGFFDNFASYSFASPIPLQAGSYWVSVSQLALNSMMLGGDFSRGSGIMKINDPFTPSIVPVYSSPYGTQWSPNDNSGDIRNLFAVESPAGQGNWTPLMPTNAPWPKSFSTIGAALPMIRVVMASSGGLSSVRSSSQSVEGMSAFPNPILSNASYVDLVYSTSQSGPATLAVFDALGKTIQKIDLGTQSVGNHAVRWNVKELAEQSLPNGIYQIVITSEGAISQSKVVIAR